MGAVFSGFFLVMMMTRNKTIRRIKTPNEALIAQKSPVPSKKEALSFFFKNKVI